MLTDLAVAFAADGTDVKVVTSRLRYDDPAASLSPLEVIDRVEVHRVWTSRFGRGNLIGRAMTEAMPNGATPKASAVSIKSESSANGLRTVLNFQRVGNQRYFDAAGFPGRTVGLDAEPSGKQKTAGK